MPSLADIYLAYSNDPSFRRDDGTQKGQGFLGAFPTLRGGVASEYSIADSEQLRDAKGNYIDYPSLVPSLTPQEIEAVMWSVNTHRPLPDSVLQKAEALALQRQAQGKPLFATARESPLRVGNTMIPQQPMAVSHSQK